MRLFACFLGFDIYVLPRGHRSEHPNLGLIQQALAIEAQTMKSLGDDRVEEDLAETLNLSSYAFVVPRGATPAADSLSGVVRFMTGTVHGVKTMWDIDRVDPDWRSMHTCLPQPVELVDAMALSPRVGQGIDTQQIVAVLLGAARCIGGALLATGRSTYVTGYLHSSFLRHARRLGYPFDALVGESSPATVRTVTGTFRPVIASLRDYDRAVRETEANSAATGGSLAFRHLSSLHDEYERVANETTKGETDEW